MNKAIILAAGVGRRLFPLTRNYPKCLLTFQGSPLLIRTLTLLGDAEIREVVIVTGHGAEYIKDAIARSRYPFRIKLLFNPFYAVTNNLVSLFIAKEEMKDGFLLLNSDVYFHPEILERVLSAAMDCLVVDDTGDYGEEAMKVVIRDGEIKDISKALNPKHCDGEYIGIARFSKEGSAELRRRMEERLEREFKDCFYEAAIKDMLESFSIFPCFTAGLPWMEIDTFEDLERVNKMLGAMINCVDLRPASRSE